MKGVDGCDGQEKNSIGRMGSCLKRWAVNESSVIHSISIQHWMVRN